ncbi:hypothetical protein K461DRAFT_319851 [Myriangium duriaei CBS 260.36]|uniref:Alternative oxidase n=1 Tax=Myriangium duriaei CBS 260.36 TaxID=1168546 RepID=A0A9P4J8M3_9PEZI|nr:hypothetical protein K461DRAFT_319851 [Myriangium duriaei CBS 260.36]
MHLVPTNPRGPGEFGPVWARMTQPNPALKTLMFAFLLLANFQIAQWVRGALAAGESQLAHPTQQSFNNLQSESLAELGSQAEPQEEPTPAISATEFVTEWASFEYGAPFDGEMLQKLCNHTDWRTDVVLQLKASRGGVGNVRAMVLDFLFLAIRSRMPIILPMYIQRSQTDLYDMHENTPETLPFGHFFDEAHFLKQMATFCPQMKIYDNFESASTNATKLKERFMPKTVRLNRMAGDSFDWRLEDLRRWIVAQKDYVANSTNIVDINWTFCVYDLRTFPRQRRMLGSLVQLQPEARRLAGTIIYNMHQRLHSTKLLDPHASTHRNLYMGAHLRTEDDADKAGWTGGHGGFDVQTGLMIQIAKAQNLSTIYLACGDPGDVKMMIEKARDTAQIQVYSKTDLLEGPDLDELKALTWDQQGVIDFEVLSRSSFYVGPSMSSFTWNVVMRRHFYNLEDDRYKKEEFAIQEDDEANSIWDDGLSRVTLKTAEFHTWEMEYYVGRDSIFP